MTVMIVRDIACCTVCTVIFQNDNGFFTLIVVINYCVNSTVLCSGFWTECVCLSVLPTFHHIKTSWEVAGDGSDPQRRW